MYRSWLPPPRIARAIVDLPDVRRGWLADAMCHVARGRGWRVLAPRGPGSFDYYGTYSCAMERDGLAPGWLMYYRFAQQRLQLTFTAVYGTLMGTVCRCTVLCVCACNVLCLTFVFFLFLYCLEQTT